MSAALIISFPVSKTVIRELVYFDNVHACRAYEAARDYVHQNCSCERKAKHELRFILSMGQ